jgi:signal transduction histidine kinase
MSILKKLRSRVFAKVLLLIYSSIFLLIVGLYFVFEQSAYERKKAELIAQQKFITQSQAVIVPRYIVNNDEERTVLVLSGVLSNPAIIGAAVYGPDGKVLYQFGKLKSDTAKVFVAAHPITNFDGRRVRSLGRLVTVATDRQIVENLNEWRRFYGLVLIALFLVIVFATYWSIHWVVATPLNRMVAAIKRARGGERIKLDWTSHDEIGLVVSEFEKLQDRQLQVQADLRETKEVAEQANRAKSEFLATMSHELRTPLNAIIGFSEFIKSETLGPINVPRYRDYLNDIHNSGAHLLSIINDILDMSKIEAGEMKVAEESVDLKETAAKCMRLMADQAAQGGVTIDVDLPPDLPHFSGDQRMMSQIILNLLSNAVKFTPPAGKVVLAMSHDDGGISISVRDTGIGIPASKLELVLEPFRQADSSDRRVHGGTGLGLSLVKSMVELHGGAIEIHSVEGEGTEVDIRLPVERMRARRPGGQAFKQSA